MRRLFGLALLVGVAAGTPLLAQPFEVAFSAGAVRQSNNVLGSYVDSTTLQNVNISLQNGFKIGFRITLNSMKYFGHEFGYGYHRTQLRYEIPGTGSSDQGMGIHVGGYNFLAYATPEGNRVRPFATVGGDFANYVPPGASATSGQGDTKFGFNYGGGIKYRITQMFQLRFDVRQYQNGKPFNLTGASGMARMMEISAGFGLVL